MSKTTKSMNETSTELTADDRVEAVKPSHLLVTNCHVFPFHENAGKTRAFARVVIADQIQMTGIRVLDGANGLFVSYPNDPGYKGDDYRSLYYPITRELRDHIEQVILEHYQTDING